MDLVIITCIKREDNRVLVRKDEIKQRWKKYVHILYIIKTYLEA